MVPKATAFRYELTLSDMQPAEGSVSGGSLVTVTGDGFSLNASNNLLKVGGQACAVQTASHGQVVCCI